MLNFIKAFFIMLKAHKKQKDKAGRPYFLHPINVAINVKGIKTKTVALLHDVLEDSDIYEISDFNFLNNEQREALLLLTHDKKDAYSEYIKNFIK